MDDGTIGARWTGDNNGTTKLDVNAVQRDQIFDLFMRNAGIVDT